MEFIHYIRILSSVTMPTCDVLLRHFGKMLLYTQGYAVAYCHLLSTLGSTLCSVLCYVFMCYVLYLKALYRLVYAVFACNAHVVSVRRCCCLTVYRCSVTTTGIYLCATYSYLVYCYNYRGSTVHVCMQLRY